MDDPDFRATVVQRLDAHGRRLDDHDKLLGKHSKDLDEHQEAMKSINGFHRQFLELYNSLQSAVLINTDNNNQQFHRISYQNAFLIFLIVLLGVIIIFK
jgi:hypothetical protein